LLGLWDVAKRSLARYGQSQENLCIPAIEDGGHMNYVTPSGIWNPYGVCHGCSDLAVLSPGAILMPGGMPGPAGGLGQSKSCRKSEKNDLICTVM
jgi:hypothetical protein